MYSETNRGPKPCKYGDKCYENQQGQCTFYHPPPQNTGQNKYKKPNHNHNHNQPHYPPQPNFPNTQNQGGNGYQQQNNQNNQMDPIMN